MKQSNKYILDQIKNILLKKAEGYFYNEEIFEYYSPENKDNEILKKVDKSGSTQLTFIKDDIQSNQKKGKYEQNTETKNLILSKKKVTSHYIPPDLTAIKMLIEIFGQEVNKNDDIESLSDQELFELRDTLIQNLKNTIKES